MAEIKQTYLDFMQEKHPEMADDEITREFCIIELGASPNIDCAAAECEDCWNREMTKK